MTVTCHGRDTEFGLRASPPLSFAQTETLAMSPARDGASRRRCEPRPRSLPATWSASPRSRRWPTPTLARAGLRPARGARLRGPPRAQSPLRLARASPDATRSASPAFTSWWRRPRSRPSSSLAAATACCASCPASTGTCSRASQGLRRLLGPGAAPAADRGRGSVWSASTARWSRATSHAPLDPCRARLAARRARRPSSRERCRCDCAADARGAVEGRCSAAAWPCWWRRSGPPGSRASIASLLFLEDVNEPLYRLDRMLTQLQLSGKLRRVKGMILGHLAAGRAEAIPSSGCGSGSARRRSADGASWPGTFPAAMAVRI